MNSIFNDNLELCCFCHAKLQKSILNACDNPLCSYLTCNECYRNTSKFCVCGRTIIKLVTETNNKNFSENLNFNQRTNYENNNYFINIQNVDRSNRNQLITRDDTENIDNENTFSFSNEVPVELDNKIKNIEIWIKNYGELNKNIFTYLEESKMLLSQNNNLVNYIINNNFAKETLKHQEIKVENFDQQHNLKSMNNKVRKSSDESNYNSNELYKSLSNIETNSYKVCINDSILVFLYLEEYNSKLVLLGTESGKIILVYIYNSLLKFYFESHKGSIYNLIPIKYNNEYYFVSVSLDNEIKLYSYSNSNPVFRIFSNIEVLGSCKIYNSNFDFAISNKLGEIKLFKIEKPNNLFTCASLSFKYLERELSMIYSSISVKTTILFVYSDSQLALYDVINNIITIKYSKEYSDTTCLDSIKILLQKEYFISDSLEDKLIKIWNYENIRSLFTFPKYNFTVYSMSFDNSDNIILCCSRKKIRILKIKELTLDNMEEMKFKNYSYSINFIDSIKYQYILGAGLKRDMLYFSLK